jgi:hypothetical protein
MSGPVKATKTKITPNISPSRDDAISASAFTISAARKKKVSA